MACMSCACMAAIRTSSRSASMEGWVTNAGAIPLTTKQHDGCHKAAVAVILVASGLKQLQRSSTVLGYALCVPTTQDHGCTLHVSTKQPGPFNGCDIPTFWQPSTLPLLHACSKYEKACFTFCSTPEDSKAVRRQLCRLFYGRK